jgi:hypothetical protein
MLRTIDPEREMKIVRRVRDRLATVSLGYLKRTSYLKTRLSSFLLHLTPFKSVAMKCTPCAPSSRRALCRILPQSSRPNMALGTLLSTRLYPVHTHPPFLLLLLLLPFTHQQNRLFSSHPAHGRCPMSDLWRYVSRCGQLVDGPMPVTGTS